MSIDENALTQMARGAVTARYGAECEGFDNLVFALSIELRGYIEAYEAAKTVDIELAAEAIAEDGLHGPVSGISFDMVTVIGEKHRRIAKLCAKAWGLRWK